MKLKKQATEIMVDNGGDQNQISSQKRKDGEGEQKRIAGVFFLVTLLIWVASVSSQILLNDRTELIVVFLGFIFFQVANFLIRKWRRTDSALFLNTCVSLLHASIISTSVVLILVNQWRRIGIREMFEHSELARGEWALAYDVVGFSCGYFAYDQLDMLIHGLYSGFIASILLHHLVLLICFTLALYRRVTINYLLLTLICELHSVFLHVRKVRRMSGIRGIGSKMVEVEWVLNWLTFTFARLVPHVLITVKLIKDASKFDGDEGLPLALSGMAGMNLLNVFLGVDLARAHRREALALRNNHHLVHRE